jgi:hypothetical protein
MKKILLFLLTAIPTFGQVGIGTVSPTKELDVNGQLRVRNLPTVNNSTLLLTTDVNGNLTKNTSALLLIDTQIDQATNNIDYTPNSTGLNIRNDINLGLSNTISIPAGVRATIITNYSIPLGLVDNIYGVNAYNGIRFLRNGIEAPAGSRKMTISQPSNATMFGVVPMSTLSATYIEEVNNSGGSTPIIITFICHGYVEQSVANINPIYRFNMWSAIGDNFNWGRGFMSTQLYIKN